MIGFWIVEKFDGDDDSAGFKTVVRAHNSMNDAIKALLFLPPYMRRSQCNISIGSKVFGVSDDATGFGAAICGVGDADFGYFFDAEMRIKKDLKVTGDVIGNADDINITKRISLNEHWHGYIDITPGGPTTSKTESPNTIATIPGV